jgi:PAS domain S-box-containing protein
MTDPDRTSPSSGFPRPAEPGELRREAESRAARAGPAERPVLDERLIHELSVHQIELEMQNEELRRAQAELEATRARYYDLYHEAPIGYCMITAATTIIDCNRSAGALFGLSPRFLKGRRLIDFVLPWSRAAFADCWDRVVASGETGDVEVGIVRPDGNPITVQLLMNLGSDDSSGHPVGRIALTDVTEQRRMAEETARLAAIVTSASHAVASYSLRGDVTTWNHGAEELFGYSAADIVGRRLTLLFPIELAHEEVRMRYDVGRGKITTMEIGLTRNGGEIVDVLLTCSPILDREQRIVGVSLLALDISEQVEARKKLAAALTELEANQRALQDADRRKDDFIATLAHELRNPLAPIRNAAAVLRHTTTLDRSAGWARDVIDRQVSHMAALLEDLLDVSRITRNTITLKVERVDLTDIIQRAIEIARPQLEARQQRLIVDQPQGPIGLTGDPIRLVQIVDNLLSNAAKYTDPGGQITVAVRVEGDEAVVTVADTGIGVDPAHLPRIFELFSQVDSVIERAQGGLGIGLALVKGLVEKHGGSVTARSEGAGHGSEFVVRLPGVESASASVGADRPAPSLARTRQAAASGQVILVVDDNADAVESMALMLRLSGFQVVSAASGEQGLVLAARHRPHAALIDVGMPGLNGYEVARRLRREAWGRDMMLIACTGWGQPEDRRRTQEAGFNHHLVKPCDPESVLRLLAEANHPAASDAQP